MARKADCLLAAVVTLRWYQQEAADSALEWVRRSVEPCLIEAATGAGKSHVIAAIAESLHKISGGKHVLCLAPSAELVVQNREKYKATGRPSSVYSASAGSKCLRHPVVFGTPGTVKAAAKKIGARFCAVIIDEAHGITPTVRAIIDAMRAESPRLRVIGLTATPYRLGSGYVYQIDERGQDVGEHACSSPYFMRLVYRITARQLIAEGFLTQPVIGALGVSGYDTSGLILTNAGRFDAGTVDRAFAGHGRKTASIIADVVEQSRNRRGVLIFAATVQHAKEALASLPPGLSAIVTGETPKRERDRILADFKAKRLKYIVNVSVLTTGFDAPHVDVIALLRATESVGLLQQIIGRGSRICEGKSDFLVLDYAENIERHCPDGDLFAPQIKLSRRGPSGDMADFKCPSCSGTNTVALRPNPDQFRYDAAGYWLDLSGQRIETDKGEPMPGHFARRCAVWHPAPGGRLVRCDYRWTCKRCPSCDHDNDIAARYCEKCRAEIVDPNKKLVADFKALKRDPTRIQTDTVQSWAVQKTMSRAGNECIRVDYVTEYRRFSVWYTEKRRATWERFIRATVDCTVMPKTITYRKDVESGFFVVIDYGRMADAVPAVA